MADQPAIQDPNRFPALIGHSGTAGTAETIRLVSTAAGALTVDLVSGDKVTVSVGTITTGSLTDLAKVYSGTINSAVVSSLPDLPGGTVDLVTGLGTLGSISNIAAVHTAGTISALPDLPGGTVDLVSSVAGGTITTDHAYSYKYTAAATANWVIKNSAGFLHAILVGDAAGTGVIEVSDHASDGDGAVVIYLAGDDLGPALYPVNMTMGTGITADVTNQTHVTMIYK